MKDGHPNDDEVHTGYSADVNVFYGSGRNAATNGDTRSGARDNNRVRLVFE